MSENETPLPYVGLERRKSWHSPDDCPLAELTNQRFTDGTQRMDRIEKSLHENTSATREVLEILQMGKGFFKTVYLLGNVLKWGVGVGAAIFALWHTWKDGP